jgi:MerR family transcriptional regulator, heat shock protein HspR
MRDRPAPGGERRLEAAAAATRVPASRVRYFVRVGLIRPSRTEGRLTFFGEAEMAQLRRIRRLRDDLGLNVAGIEVALRLIDEIEGLRRELGKGTDRAGADTTQRPGGRRRGLDKGASNGRS